MFPGGNGEGHNRGRGIGVKSIRYEMNYREIVEERGAWQAAVHGVTKSQARLSD